ncbi:histone deacetylase 15 [Coccidioides immitis RMSCC 3703]|uniref:histone deacetylase n=1 Tax=Coccidioides immitis RMSCC 3703 TaxID=454286 RepID=A0A0J8QP99_COCIT|nr:histone deacetylase 15 [Coccidioides immitis RMSCC 3703]
MGDGDYLYAFQEVIMPIGYEFNPDLVIISAGFDAAAGDELGGCFVTPPCYAHMTSMLMNLANGKVAVCLEAGVSTVRKVTMIQSKYWQCMYPKGPPERFWGNRVHDIIRQYQAKQLYDDRNYDWQVPLLVIFHDPPELMGIPHPLTNKLEAHNCWMADGVKDYIEWAMNRNIAVIDVNIPKHITRSNTADRYEDEDRSKEKMASELAVYLWENYIEYEFFSLFSVASCNVADC